MDINEDIDKLDRELQDFKDEMENDLLMDDFLGIVDTVSPYMKTKSVEGRVRAKTAPSTIKKQRKENSSSVKNERIIPSKKATPSVKIEKIIPSKKATPSRTPQPGSYAEALRFRSLAAAAAAGSPRPRSCPQGAPGAPRSCRERRRRWLALLPRPR